jgi:hypothetical protein
MLFLDGVYIERADVSLANSQFKPLLVAVHGEFQLRLLKV